jgi:hypothetical protein
MKRSGFWSACAAAVVLVASASVAHAQPPAPGGPRPPAFSPYLNLARPGSPAVLNYFGLVRPELQFRQSLNNLQQEVTANQQMIGGLAAGDPLLPATGHTAQFMNHYGYFMNNASGGFPVGGYGVGSPFGSGPGMGVGVGGGVGGVMGGTSQPPRRR